MITWPPSVPLEAPPDAPKPLFEAPTDAALLAAARPFNAYDGAKEITIRGSVDVLGFARAVLALGGAA